MSSKITNDIIAYNILTEGSIFRTYYLKGLTVWFVYYRGRQYEVQEIKGKYTAYQTDKDWFRL